MVTLPEFKEALGDYAEELTEQEIEKLKRDEEQLADILIEHVLRENQEKAKNSPPLSVEEQNIKR